MRPGGRAETVMGCLLAGDPGPQGLVDGVLERAGAALHGVHLGAQQFHAPDIGGLALHILAAHVDDAIHAQTRGGRRRGHAVLSRAGFRHQGRLAHVFRQQGLAQGIVDLVRAGMQQILALEPEVETQFLRKRGAKGQRRGPTGVIAQKVVQLRLKFGRGHDLAHGRFHFQQRRHEQLGHKAAPEFTEITVFHFTYPLPLVVPRLSRPPPFSANFSGPAHPRCRN